MHHRDLIFLGDRAVVQREIRGKGSEQEIDLVGGDELDILAHAEIDVRLIVENLQRELIGLAADLDAARGVDRVDRELVGVAIIAPGIGARSGQLDGGAERNDVVGACRLPPTSHKGGRPKNRRALRATIACFIPSCPLVCGTILAECRSADGRGENSPIAGLREAGIGLLPTVVRRNAEAEVIADGAGGRSDSFQVMEIGSIPIDESGNPFVEGRRRTIAGQFIEKIRIGIGGRDIAFLHFHVIATSRAAASLFPPPRRNRRARPGCRRRC